MLARLKWLWALGVGFAFAACGSRTGLLFDESEPDAGADAAPDVSHHDAGKDAKADHKDALPPIDASVPDVVKPNNCTDAAITLIYLFSDLGELLSFDPATLTLTDIGKVDCPTNATPNSMAVDHLGVAYANFVAYEGSTLTQGEIWKLSTANAKCTSTSYSPQFNFLKFGMGFVGDNDGGENLYIANTEVSQATLARVILPSMKLELEGTLNPPVANCELTGRSDGQLFAFCIQNGGSRLVQVDPQTATVVAEDKLTVGNTSNSFAFAFWGGKFWIFTGVTGQGSSITEYDPATHSETLVKTTSQTIVGAGVSTCAPIE